MTRTLSVDIRVLSEAILHRLELFDTINPLGIRLREYETGKCLAELHAAGTISHPTKARTIPIDFPSDGVECASGGRFFFLFRRYFTTFLVYMIRLGF